MDEPRPSPLVPLLALVPGLGHWWLGRVRRGLRDFVLVTGLLNAVPLLRLSGDEGLATVGARLAFAAAAALWAVAYVDAFRLGVLRRMPSRRERRRVLFREAFDRFVRGQDRRARELLVRLLDGDARDPRARLWLAALARRQGNHEEARAHLRRALGGSPPRVWRDRLRREVSKLEERS